jgi:hypothetical protein
MHWRMKKSAAGRLFRSGIASVKEMPAVCAIIDKFVRLSYFALVSEGLREGLEEGSEGSATVAEGEFGCDVELGHGFFLVGEVEEGVVAEALGAAWSGEDLAFYGAVSDGEDLSVAGGGEDAVVAGWMRARNLAEGLLQAEVVALVWSAGCGEVVVVGVTGRADAGVAMEGVYFEAGVVGEDDVVGGVAGVEDGFETGVAFEGGLVFVGGGDLFEAGEGSDGYFVRDGGEVSELAWVGRGDVESHASIGITSRRFESMGSIFPTIARSKRVTAKYRGSFTTFRMTA